jgi:single-stranded DNA-binding protein
MKNMIILEGVIAEDAHTQSNYHYFSIENEHEKADSVIMIRCYSDSLIYEKLTKGVYVSIVGYLQSEEWEVDGKNIHNLFIHADEVKIKQNISA